MEVTRHLVPSARALRQLLKPSLLPRPGFQCPASRRFLSQPSTALRKPFRPCVQSSQLLHPVSKRTNVNSSDPRPLTDRSDTPPNQDEAEEREVPAYQLTFTCKPCLTRSAHRITKQGYHSGTVLITCPNCKNRHIISDHLKIFSDESTTIEDILEAKGELIKKGRLGMDGDMEFWDNPTVGSTRKEDSSGEVKTETGAI